MSESRACFYVCTGGTDDRLTGSIKHNQRGKCDDILEVSSRQRRYFAYVWRHLEVEGISYSSLDRAFLKQFFLGGIVYPCVVIVMVWLVVRARTTGLFSVHECGEVLRPLCLVETWCRGVRRKWCEFRT